MNQVRLMVMESQLPRLNPKRDSDQRFQVRVAAIGDLHVRGTEDQRNFPRLCGLPEVADLLVVAGDLTENGRVFEAEAAADLLSTARLPVIAVLGNHDLRTLRRAAFRRVFERRGIEVLEGSATVVRVSDGYRVGIAGATGSGGGFWLQEGPDAIHTRTFKRLAIRVSRECAALERALLALETEVRIATMHFAPTTSTLGVEPLAKYWMLGNCELGVVLDRCMPDLVIHGHAHLGTLNGRTPGGIPVRNVALPVVKKVHLETLELTPGSAASRSSSEPAVRWR
jgi:Icc-related predicted phosphoesterase